MRAQLRTTNRLVLLSALTLSLTATPAFAGQPGNCPVPTVSITNATQNVPEVVVGANGVRVPTVVTLAATVTGAATSYAWTQESSGGAPNVSLSNANTLVATFTAPDVGSNPTNGTNFKFKFTATNACLTDRTTDASENANVNVTDVRVNRPPLAVLTASATTVDELGQVTLSAVQSTDPDGDQLDYEWLQTLGTPVVLTVAGSGKTATFVAPENAYPNGEMLKFKVTVSDGALDDDAEVIVNVRWVNNPPAAALSCPASVNERAGATLSAAGSSDSDNGIAAYSWQQTLGPPDVGVTGATGISASFTAPSLTFQQSGQLRFRLTVSDGLASDSKECLVTINDITPPVLSGLTNITIPAVSSLGATTSFAPTAFDAVDGATSVSCTPFSGALFKIGTTTVTCKSADSKGNESSGTFDVTVTDTVPPVIAASSDITVEATSPAGALVSYATPGVTDNIDTGLVASCAPPSGSQFGVGNTTVTCSAKDTANNTATSSFTVKVTDTTAPAISGMPSDINLEATSGAGAVATWTAPNASDIVDGDRSVSCIPASGSTFAIGSTTVNCTASDTRGNSASASFKVVVKDSTAPSITAPANMTLEATSAAGAAATFSVTANDVVDGSIVPTCTPSSGSTFALGTTTVNCSATDAHGNTAKASFTVTVQDTQPPAITTPADISQEASASAGNVVTYSASANDVVDGSVTVSCSPASGSTFAVGDTTVSCSASDSRGNSASKSFKVSIADTTPPDLTVPAPIADVEATSAAGAAVSFAVSAVDIVDGAVTPSCTRESGSTFSIGTTTVKCTATDIRGNKSEKTFTVTVKDSTPPVVTVPADMKLEATAANGAPATFAATAADAVTSGLTPVCTPASGSTFPIGTTPVNCSSTDFAGNTGSASFKVTVVDTTPPALTVPANMTVEATSGSGAAVSFNVSATDLVTASPNVSCNPASGSTFPLGTTTVACTARDASNNESSRSFTIAVRDTIAPTVNVPMNKVVEATGPSGAPVTFAASAQDAVTSGLTTTCDRQSGSTFAIGTTTVSCSSTDAAGNTGSASFTVKVQDTTPPTLDVPANITTFATGPLGASVSYAVTASDLVDGTIVPSCTSASGSTFAPGTKTVTCTATDARNNVTTKSFTVSVVYNWTGFYQPVNMNATNAVKAGSAIPVKFSLGGNMGLDVLEAGFPRAVAASCTGGVTEEITDAETIPASSNSFNYDAAANQYVFVWKSEKSWSGRCLQLQVKLRDGTNAHFATFSFTK